MGGRVKGSDDTRVWMRSGSFLATRITMDRERKRCSESHVWSWRKSMSICWDCFFHERPVLEDLISITYRARRANAKLTASAAPQPLRASAPCRDPTGASIVESHTLLWPCVMCNS